MNFLGAIPGPNWLCTPMRMYVYVSVSKPCINNNCFQSVIPTLMDGTTSMCGFKALRLDNNNLDITSTSWSNFSFQFTATDTLEYIVLFVNRQPENTTMPAPPAPYNPLSYLGDVYLDNVSIVDMSVKPVKVKMTQTKNEFCIKGAHTINVNVKLDTEAIGFNSSGIKLKTTLPSGFKIASVSDFNDTGFLLIAAGQVSSAVSKNYKLILIPDTSIKAETDYTFGVRATDSFCASDSSIVFLKARAKSLPLTIDKSSLSNLGSKITYTLKICNTTSSGVNAVIADTLPANSTIDSLLGFVQNDNALSRNITIPSKTAAQDTCLYFRYKVKMLDCLPKINIAYIRVPNHVCNDYYKSSDTVNKKDSFTASIIGLDTICKNDSFLLIAKVSNPTLTGMTYVWAFNDTIIAGQVSDSLRLRAKQGKYTVRITNSKGCESVSNKFVRLYNSSTIIDTIESAYCIKKSGSIKLGIVGAHPHRFLWSSADTLQNLDSLYSGVYTVVITDNKDCKLYDTFYVPLDSGEVSLSFFHDYDCWRLLAKTTIIPMKGLAPYKLIWSDGDTSRIKDSMTIGLYTVNVTDSLGCSVRFDVNHTFQNTILTDKYITQPKCGKKGSIKLVPENGIRPYEYFWIDQGFIGDSFRNDLSSGTYVVVVSDSMVCYTYDTIIILPDPTPSSLDAYIQTKTSCQSGIPTQLQAIQISGNPNITYQWSTGANTANIAVTNNSAKYTVTITEPNGCNKIISTTPDVDSFLRLGDGYGAYGFEDLQSAIAAGRLSSPMLSKLDISIKGRFTLNANADIRHCNIVMSEGAIIDVPTDCNGNSVDSLTMLNNQIYTCGNKLAHGISIRKCFNTNNMSGFHLRFSNNEIRDCYKALEIRRSMIPYITDNLFEDNMIGMHIFGDDILVCTPYPKAIIFPNYLLSIYGNKFRGSSPLDAIGKVKSAYAGLVLNQYIKFRPSAASAASGVPLAGIIAENTRTLKLGLGNYPPNIFENLNNGILSYGSELYLYNTLFKDILYKASTPMREYAIYSEGNRYTNKGSLILGGYSSNALPHVSNTLNGIICQRP